MTKSVYQTVECDGCGAAILTDTRGPLSTDPNDHEDDCPKADAWDETTWDRPLAEHEAEYNAAPNPGAMSDG